MTTQEYLTKAGVKQVMPVMTEAEYRAVDNEGFCLACGAEASCVEPDARKYPCEVCDARKVYGYEELLMMGLLRFKD